jgi:hypothetical protein
MSGSGGGGFSVQPESFAPAAQQLSSAAEQLLSQWAPLRAQTEAVRFGRGDDPVSPLIQVSLAGAVSLVENCMSSTAKVLGQVATGLEKMGKNYQEVEEGTDAAIRKLGGKLWG